jgi:hypothetical protein
MTKKIIISIDVVIAENEKWSWRKGKKIAANDFDNNDDEAQDTNEVLEPVNAP